MKTKQFLTPTLITVATLLASPWLSGNAGWTSSLETDMNEYEMNTPFEKNGEVYEVVLYQIKDAENKSFEELSTLVAEHLSTYDGYIGSETHRSIDKPNLYLDIVHWKSLETAKAAQKQFESAPNAIVQRFLTSIDHVRFADHVRTLRKHSYADLDGSEVLEFAVIYTQEGALDRLLGSHAKLMQYINRGYEEFKHINTVQSVDNPNLLIDLAHWANAEVCPIVQKEVESHELFMNFASTFNMEKEQDMIMEYFTRLR